MFAGAIATLTQALRLGDRIRSERALEKARALQPRVDEWKSSIDTARAMARISPFLLRDRSELERYDRIAGSMDLATRNLRVVARHVRYLSDDSLARPVAADVLAELARGADLVAESLEDISLEPAAREALQMVAQRLDPGVLVAGAPLGDQNLIVSMRPLAVDLLTASGVPSLEARKIVPRL